MSMSYNIAVVGVGGQGLLTLGSIIGVACIKRKLDVAIAEVHGMSQRGGSVIVHVRIGDEPSPIIPIGGADHIISLELLEAARYIHYARRNSIISINDFIWPPPLANYPSREDLLRELRGKDVILHLLDANGLSNKIVGSPISANIAMLGFALGVDRNLRSFIDIDSVKKSLEEHFRGRVLELNMNLLLESYKIGLDYAEKNRGTE
ncbi:MAG: indolepyruvate oxidoreductase subunit beta [Desulfurococcaceae archaeon]